MLSASSTPVQRMPDVMASHAAEVSATPPLLVVEDIAKSYGGAHALRGVSLSMRPGEVHGLVGANGAGKSTLIRILAGLTQPDRGLVRLDGEAVAIATPHRATALGLGFIHQGRG